MSSASDRRIAAVFGILGGALLGLEGLFDLIRGVVLLAVGRGFGAFGPFDEAVILLVVALVVILFSGMGALRFEGRATVAGVVLIVIAVVGWLGLGFGGGVLSILGALLTLIAGVVFLVSGR